MTTAIAPPAQVPGARVATVHYVRTHAHAPRRYVVVSVRESLYEAIVPATARCRLVAGARVLHIAAGALLPRNVARAWRVPPHHCARCGDDGRVVRIVPALIAGVLSEAVVVPPPLPSPSPPLAHGWSTLANAAGLVDVMQNPRLLRTLLDTRVFLARCVDGARHALVLRVTFVAAHNGAVAEPSFALQFAESNDERERHIARTPDDALRIVPAPRATWPRRVAQLARALGDARDVELRALCTRVACDTLRRAATAATASQAAPSVVVDDGAFAQWQVYEVLLVGDTQRRHCVSTRAAMRLCRAHGVRTVRASLRAATAAPRDDRGDDAYTLRQIVNTVLARQRSLLPYNMTWPRTADDGRGGGGGGDDGGDHRDAEEDARVSRTSRPQRGTGARRRVRARRTGWGNVDDGASPPPTSWRRPARALSGVGGGGSDVDHSDARQVAVWLDRLRNHGATVRDGRYGGVSDDRVDWGRAVAQLADRLTHGAGLLVLPATSAARHACTARHPYLRYRAGCVAWGSDALRRQCAAANGHISDDDDDDRAQPWSRGDRRRERRGAANVSSLEQRRNGALRAHL